METLPLGPRRDVGMLDALRDLTHRPSPVVFCPRQPLAAARAIGLRALAQQPHLRSVMGPKSLHEPASMTAFLVNGVEPLEPPRADVITRLRAIGSGARRQGAPRVDEIPSFATTLSSVLDVRYLAQPGAFA